MDRYEYLKLPLYIIPDEIIQQCKLQGLENQGFLHMWIPKGVYRLTQ